MKTEDWRGGIEAQAEGSPARSQRPQDNPHVVSALEEYLAAVEAGRTPDRGDFLARHKDIADALAECLDGLDFIRAAASRVRDASRDSSASIANEASLQPEAPLGDYRLVREVGRGGMGVVYEAVQISLGRRVALKVLPFAAALDGRQLQRFKNEAQAAAHLHHQHIVPVYAVGCERGVHFYAMQFIEGRTLAAVIDELRGKSDQVDSAADLQATGPYSAGPLIPVTSQMETVLRQSTRTTKQSTSDPAMLRAAVTLGVQASEALEYAHQFGIIHRDIKPANLLVDARGQLWITDFGLAQIQGDAKLTMSGDLLGTLRYMSPEQALAQRVHLDHRTDIYSLGLTLYELLTLEPAFKGHDRQELLRKIAFEEPRKPRLWNRSIPWELETIVLKAIAKNPAERYATAREFADDLRRFQEDKPIRARRPSLIQRARKWARRHQPIVWAAGVILALTLLGVAGGALLLQRAASEKAATAKRTSEELKLQLYYQTIALAERHHSAGSIGLAERLLNSEELCPPDLHGWEWHFLKGLCRGSPKTLEQSSILFSQALSPDGSRLAVGGNDGTVTVWDTRTWQAKSFRAPAAYVRGLVFTPDGSRLWSGGTDGSVHLWDPTSGKRLRALGEGQGRKDAVGDLGLSPDGRLLAVTDSRVVTVWDTKSGRRLVELAHPETSGPPLAFSPDGRLLATGRSDRDLSIWDTSTWQERFALQGHGGATVECSAFSPNGNLLATGSRRFMDDSDDSDVIIWDMETGQRIHTLRGFGGGVCSVAFSPDGQRLATGGSENPTLKVWDVATGQECLTLRGHHETIFRLAFSPDGHRLYSASADHTVRVWDGTPVEARVGAELQVLRGHAGRVNSLAFTPDCRGLVSGGMDRTVRRWDIGTGHEVQTLVRGASPIYAVAISPDGALLATGSFCALQGSPEQPELRIWDARAWQERLCLPLLNDDGAGIPSLAFSPDSRRLALTTCEHPTIVDVTTGLPLINLFGGKRLVLAVTFGSRGQIAWGGMDGEVMVWQESLDRYAMPAAASVLPSPFFCKLTSTWMAAEVRPTHLLSAHNSRVFGIAFAPDESRLASCGIDGVIKVWDRDQAGWKLRLSLTEHLGAVHAVAFSPDGLRLASAGLDGTIRVWDLEAGRQLTELRGHTDSAYTVVYSPDGHYLASGSSDGTIRIWDAQRATVEQSRVDRDAEVQQELSANLIPHHNARLISHKSTRGRK